MGRWHTPLFLVSKDAEDTPVEIPDSGWYGFCFGMNNDDEDDLRDDDEKESNDTIFHHFQLRLQIQPPDSDEQTSPIKIPLPLMHKERRLLKLNYGKIIFLTKGARVTVRNDRPAENLEAMEEQENNAQRNDDADTCNEAEFKRSVLKADEIAKYHWMLIVHQFKGREQQAAALCENLPLLGSYPSSWMSSKKRPKSARELLCAKCARGFCNISAVEKHWEDSHAPPLDDMWTRPLPILYQDDCMAVVLKPQGMPVTGGRNNLYRSDLLLSLVDGTQRKKIKTGVKQREKTEGSDLVVAGNTCDSYNDDVILNKPRLAHRLDAGTGGLLVVAKTLSAERHLKASFANRLCRKTYLTLILGKMPEPLQVDKEGFATCDLPLSDQSAVTRWKTREIIPCCSETQRLLGRDCFTVVELRPVTGRKHQLRRHLQLLGHPILGDKRYGGLPLLRSKATVPRALFDNMKESIEPEDATKEECPNHLCGRLCLWAVKLQLPHPLTNEELTFTMEEPEWLKYVIQKELSESGFESSHDEKH